MNCLHQIAINGQHFAVFEHRIPHSRVSHFAVDGDITVSTIEYGGGLGGGMPMHGAMPMYGAMPMHGAMPVSGAMPMPTSGPPGPGYPGAYPAGNYPVSSSLS